MSSIPQDVEITEAKRPQTIPVPTITYRDRLATFPWWIVGMIALGTFAFVAIAINPTYTRIFGQLRAGVIVTLTISFTGYAIALVIGVIVGSIRAYPPDRKTGVVRIAAYHLATFYVQLFRGLPILVALLIMTFIVVPRALDWLGTFGLEIRSRDVSYMWRAIIALGVCYGAFLSETFRGGVQSVGRGQREAAKAVGLNNWQAMRYVVLPQAVRRVLPPLGNDLIAMIKDSSLVAILAVRDITQLAKLSAGQSFMYMETYMVAAVLYLSMTMIGSLLVRWLERTMHSGDEA
jgi:polar amino acid transport system permease protein